MAAKASRAHTLFLLVVLTVASLTATVTVAPYVATAGPIEPVNNGDPDRPNDCPKPATQPSIVNGSILPSGVGAATGSKREASGWSWAMSFIATLLGRHGL